MLWLRKNQWENKSKPKTNKQVTNAYMMCPDNAQHISIQTRYASLANDILP